MSGSEIVARELTLRGTVGSVRERLLVLAQFSAALTVKRRFCHRTGAAALVLSVAVVATYAVLVPSQARYLFLATAGLAVLSVIVCAGYLRLTKDPVRTTTPGTRFDFIELFFLGVFGSVFLFVPVTFIVKTAFLDSVARSLVYQKPYAPWAGLIVGSIVFFAWTRFNLASRLRNVAPVRGELEWLGTLVDAFADVSPLSRKIKLVANPYLDELGRKPLPSTRTRPGYTYSRFRNVSCQLSLVYSSTQSFALTVIHDHETKTKNRKSKYKGTKHKIRVILNFRDGAIRAQDQDFWAEEIQVRRLSGQPSLNFSHVLRNEGRQKASLQMDRRVRVKDGALRVILMFKAQDREHGLSMWLPSPEEVLSCAKKVAAAVNER